MIASRSARLASSALAGALLLAGCTLAPSPAPPEVAAPERWRAPALAGDAIAESWWTAFGDPALDALVAEALAANRDLRQAAARVEEARALARIAGADRLPRLDLEGAVSRSRQSEATPNLPPGVDPLGNHARLAASVAFELDLFGRIRHGARAAREDLVAAGYARDAVSLAVASEVVSAWFELAALDRQAEVAGATVDARRSAHGLVEERFAGGLTSRLDVERSRAERAAVEAALPEIERQQRATENRLSVLLGRMPGDIVRGRDLSELAVPEVPAGLPSVLLLRRSDVAASEARLAASAARVGEARAALFPSIRLTGSYGRESAELSDLFTPGALVWQVAAGLLQPIFHGGRNRALVAASEARQEQSVAAYLAAAEGAFREVEDALFATGSQRRRRSALEEQAQALGAARALVYDRYREGESSFLEVLDVERSRLGAELELAGARRDELQAAVALFRALGGGFDSDSGAGAPR